MAQKWMQGFLNPDPPSVEDIEAALEDFGFFHGFKDASRMFAEYENNKQYGYAGGVLDQPEEYWSDIAMFKWLELWVKHVASMPRMEQRSVFDTLRNEGRFGGKWLGGGDASD